MLYFRIRVQLTMRAYPNKKSIYLGRDTIIGMFTSTNRVHRTEETTKPHATYFLLNSEPVLV